jgi:hypothetical protein
VLPPPIVAIGLGTIGLTAYTMLTGVESGIETIGTHFGVGAIPTSLPMPGLPEGIT